MRNFLLFLRRFSNLILFLGLEIVCIVLIARSGTLPGDDVMNSANGAIGFFYQKQNDVAYYFGLRRMNDSLLVENARLYQQIAAARYSVDTLQDSSASIAITKPASDTTQLIQYAQYTFRKARVINNSVAERNNFITINRGSADGIKREMAVISTSGVVGRVLNVSEHFATVVSVLSETRPVSAKLKDGTTRTVKWRVGSPDVLYMEDVPQEIEIKLGDSVLTTSYSFFPADVLVGTVRKAIPIRKNNTRILHLKPGNNFRNMQYVYVVENSYQAEQRELESQNKIPEAKRR